MNAPAATPWYLKRAAVIVMLMVFGLLGLLPLWKSPEFDRPAKWKLTGVSLAVAAVLVAVTPWLVRMLEAKLAAAGML